MVDGLKADSWRWLVILVAILLSATAAFSAAAGEADVVDVKVHQSGNGAYRFDVTVRHADAGWDHYADRWDVLGPDGEVLGSRKLLHPHDNEQPFTRSLSGVVVPPGVDRVSVRAHDSVHGLGGRVMEVTLPGR